MQGTLAVTGNAEADALLNTDPLALVVGMMLDQQVPMEWAFAGPRTLAVRLGGLDTEAIAAMDPEALEAVFREKPAMHRYPGSMARRTHDLCRHLVEHHGGRPETVWTEATSGHDLVERVRALPGYGDEKARIFVALLGKRLGVRPPGWEQASAPFSDDQPRSVADVHSPESLQQVRQFKKAMKAAGKGKADSVVDE